LNIKDVRITVLGITFKENIADIRNSKSIEIVNQLQQLGLSIQICDPYAPTEINGIPLTPFHQLKKSSVLNLTVPPKEFLKNTENNPSKYAFNMLQKKKTKSPPHLFTI